MRGKVSSVTNIAIQIGITPAYAGKSKIQNRQHIPVQDHPRLCGEKVRVTVETSVYPGSPPPMRGKECAKEYLACVEGITPAYAGKREWYDDVNTKVVGSPPPMRGKD